MSTPQEVFWTNKITESYAQDNSIFDEPLGLRAWEKILSKIDKSDIASYLDCGSNIGRNIAFLKKILPAATANIVELAKEPYDKCIKDFQINESFLGPIKNSRFEQKFDLVLMDINMPVVDGYTATSLIRQFEADTNQAKDYCSFSWR